MLSPRRFLLALAVACAFARCLFGTEPAADLGVMQGRVLTVDKNFSVADAVAMGGNLFVHVGDAAGAKRFVGPQTRVLGACGASVVPGLFETHVHAVGVARDQADEPFRLELAGGPPRLAEEEGCAHKTRRVD